MNIFQRLAVENRVQLDAEQLVWDLLNFEYPEDTRPDVSVNSQLDLEVDTEAFDGTSVYMEVGEPVQVDRGLWRFPLSLTIMSDGRNHPALFARDLYRRVLNWVFAPRDASKAGHVSKVMVLSGFHRSSESKENGGKNITEYEADLVLEARDPL